MPRYKLTIAYDGTAFHGWQKQTLPADNTNAQDHIRQGHAHDIVDGLLHLRTVQETLHRAVTGVVRQETELLGASRTDSGVHARGQVAAFSCEPRDQEFEPTPSPAPTTPDTQPAAPPAPRGIGWPLDRGCDRLVAAINSRLPPDVLVTAAEVVPHDFDPISGAVRKAYSYAYHIGPDRPLWDRSFVHYVRRTDPLDLAAMNRAAAMLVGEHDFAAFAAAGHGRLSTVRTVFRCEVRQTQLPAGGAGGGLVNPSVNPLSPQKPATPTFNHAPATRYSLHIEGSGFLWNMVRIIAGTLLQVGTGQKTPEDLRRALDAKDRTLAGPTIGPEGLCLEWIQYAPSVAQRPA